MPVSEQDILENICVHLHVMTSALSCNGRVCVCAKYQQKYFLVCFEMPTKNEIVSCLALLALSGLLSSGKCSRHIEKRLVLSSCHVRF